LILAERGITVSHETIRQWYRSFGKEYAQKLRQKRGQPGDKWHIDEVFIKINGKTHYLWRAVDQNGIVLDIIVTQRRDKAAAKRFFLTLLKGLNMNHELSSRINFAVMALPCVKSCLTSSTGSTRA
jgi:putative transposase